MMTLLEFRRTSLTECPPLAPGDILRAANLTDAANAAGNVDLYIGDDGQVWQSQ